MVLNILLLFLENLVLVGLALGLHSQRQKIGVTPLFIFIGVMVGILQFTIPTNVFVQPVDWLTINVQSVTLVPTILLTVLILYIFDGTTAARQAILSIIAISMVVLGLLFTTGMHLKLPGGGNFANLSADTVVFSAQWRTILASIIAFLADLVSIVIIYQGATNRRISIAVAVGLALWGSLLVDGLVFPLVHDMGSRVLWADLPGHLLGKSIGALVIWPITALYVNYHSHHQPGYEAKQDRHVFAVLFGRLGEVEHHLRQTESRLATIIDSTLDAIIILDEKFQISLFNQAAEDMFKIKADDAYGKSIEILSPTIFEKGCFDFHTLAGRKGSQYQRPAISLITGRRQDGELFPMEVTCSKIELDGDIYYTTILRDVTTRQENEQRLQENRADLMLLNEITRNALESPKVLEVLQAINQQFTEAAGANVGLFTLWDESQHTTQVSAVYGIDAHPWVGKSTQPGIETITYSALQNKKWLAFEDVNTAPVAHPEFLSRIQIQSAMVLPLFSGERKIGAVILGYRQRQKFSPVAIDRLMNFANQVSLALDKALLLEETRQYLKREEQLVEIAHLLSAETNLPNLLKQVAQKACEITNADSGYLALVDENGRQVDELYSYNLPDGFPITSPQPGVGITWSVIQTKTSQRVNKYSQHPKARMSPIFSFVKAIMGVPVISNDTCIGSLVLFNYNSDYLFTERDQSLVEAIGLQAGVSIEKVRLLTSLETRVAQRTQKLETANQQLMRVDTFREKFISNISHELRAPITNITLYLDLLERYHIAGIEKHLVVLKNEANRLMGLVDDILVLVRLEQYDLVFNMEYHPLDDLIDKVQTVYLARFHEKHLKWQHHPYPHTPQVKIGYKEIQQVFNNLIGNAVAYSPVGGVITASVEYHPGQRSEEAAGRQIAEPNGEYQPESLAADGAGEVVVKISNDGAPIDPIDIPHLFDRFYRGQNALKSTEPGSGLGLAICKEIIERHGGRIEFVSTTDSRNSFVIHLPVK